MITSDFDITEGHLDEFPNKKRLFVFSKFVKFQQQHKKYL
jgi:hypothetical protein